VRRSKGGVGRSDLPQANRFSPCRGRIPWRRKYAAALEIRRPCVARSEGDRPTPKQGQSGKTFGASHVRGCGATNNEKRSFPVRRSDHVGGEQRRPTGDANAGVPMKEGFAGEATFCKKFPPLHPPSKTPKLLRQVGGLSRTTGPHTYKGGTA
jgi:hypothetical protein